MSSHCPAGQSVRPMHGLPSFGPSTQRSVSLVMLVSRPLTSARNACVLRAGLSPVWLPVLSKHRTVARRMGISGPVKGRHRAGRHTPEYPPPYPCVSGRGCPPRPAVGCRIPGAPRPRLGSATSSQDPRAKRVAALATPASRASARRSIGSPRAGDGQLLPQQWRELSSRPSSSLARRAEPLGASGRAEGKDFDACTMQLRVSRRARIARRCGCRIAIICPSAPGSPPRSRSASARPGAAAAR